MIVGVGFGIVLLIGIGIYYADFKKDKHGVQIEMIRAQLMLLSNDTKEIEEFLMHKEPYITKEMIDKLINRVAEIKAEEVIDNDWARIEAPKKPGTN